MASIELNDIKKVYSNGVEAIKGVDLEVADKEFIVIVGPSGCGKSTLLRMIAGLEEITSGTLQLDDEIINKLEPAERDIAMVFQNYALYPHMSVFNNMAYGLKNRKVPKAEIEQRVNEAAKILELDQLLDRKPSQLSGGQRQRVAMGRAIVRKPKLFLFDEPLSNLDARLRGQMRIEIKQLQRKLATTAIYVTHDQVEAMTLGDRLIVMNQGKAEQIGTPSELYHKPATLYVAGFLGSPTINVMEGRIVNGAFVMRNGTRLQHQNLSGPRPANLAVRPEDIDIVSPGHEDSNLMIEMVEELGSEKLAIGSIVGTTQKLTVRVPKETRLKEGEIVPVLFKRENWHMFDVESGMRIEFEQHNQKEVLVAIA
ncbi:sn-glycerol-3-phosphate ABC transporter ATP-binding protein UgpC [Endozoicomonas sp. OPT23]|uniref:sn-glycerol-3-phosphate ABC transporter ATP-binding protein UgpC n=1 Tax=Endozoicomonas sp. OPT23 TaxID=2072845 RepID=UPI00129A3812|nr:sn-glycerol-3-phosphate ABC transporter ATP-binding protein UgpC [Endozoicomonas sp. OPT23]MRI34213.1 sn-glycerol-3-phosphate ABC transporter ATP-binding protein UgpC [Endozoicomonas sp. OPT23]